MRTALLLSLRWAPPVATALMVGAYLALLRSGRWTDEFFDFWAARTHGAGYWLHRVLDWSPRPVSEAFLWAYGDVVAVTGRPLIAPALLMLWLILIASLLLPALRPGAEAGQRAADVAIGLGQLILCLSGTPVAEMYYWPAGAAAYMGTLSGVCVLLSVGSRPAPRAAALLMASGTSEVGALFAVAYVGLRGLLAAPAVWRGRRRGPDAMVSGIWLVVPFTLAVVALALVGHGRMHTIEFAPVPGGSQGHLLASLVAGIRQLSREAFGAAAVPVMEHLGAGLAVTVIFAARAMPGRDVGATWSVAVAAVAAAALSVTAAYYHFGLACCDRHVALRHGLLLIACAAAGLGLRPLWSRTVGRWMRWDGFSPAAMSVLALVAFLPDLPRLWHDWRQQGQVTAARDATWASGRHPGPAMVFHLPPDGAIVSGPGFPPGVYTRDGAASTSQWPMLFFGKDRITVRPD